MATALFHQASISLEDSVRKAGFNARGNLISKRISGAAEISGGRRMRVKLQSCQIVCTLNPGGSQSGILGDGSQPGGSAGGGGDPSGGTRLGRLLRERQKDLIGKLIAVRKNLPLKVFLLLLGFYSANALATILGQTGDWDVLVAGILVAAIEGIGVLIYKMPIMVEKFLVIMRLINFWKAGLTFGLFVDAFKLGS